MGSRVSTSCTTFCGASRSRVIIIFSLLCPPTRPFFIPLSHFLSVSFFFFFLFYLRFQVTPPSVESRTASVHHDNDLYPDLHKKGDRDCNCTLRGKFSRKSHFWMWTEGNWRNGCPRFEVAAPLGKTAVAFAGYFGRIY